MNMKDKENDMDNKYNKYGILAIGRGCANSYKQLKYIMELQNEFDRLCTLYGCDKVKQIMKLTSCSVFEIEEYINKVQFTEDNIYLFDMDYLSSYTLQELSSEPMSINRITQLKSQLKHCKNPLQRLNIERELNRLYKNKEK